MTSEARNGDNFDLIVGRLSDMAQRFRKEHAFLSGEDDSPTDKAVGQAYLDCAKEIEWVITAPERRASPDFGKKGGS